MYGPDDERFWSFRTGGNGSIWTLRDLNGQVLRQYDSHVSWGTYGDYIYRDGVLFANFLSDGQRRHFDVDHLGTVRLVTNSAGNQVGLHTYYPFGKENTALQEGDRMKFTGHERDLANPAGDGDDLDYMHARHYSMITGRFLGTDPINSGKPNAPQSWNRYTYALENPLRFIDLNGLEPLDASVRSFLQGYYSADFSKVQAHGGVFARLMAGRALAITYGNQIFFSRTGWTAYKSIHAAGATDKIAIEGISLVGHEVTHTLQARQYGLLSFLARYAGQWVRVGFDYWKIPFELQAFANDEAIAKLLLENPALLQSIRGATPPKISQAPTASDWQIVTSISDGPLGGLSALFDFGGTLYIDGINFTGVFY
jgi:RHS repeat-associated protein